ncbi:MAK10-like protein [Tanacetum coccineum]
MGDENPIRTLGDYSKPSHEDYKNTIELRAGNNVVPLRSDTIRLVQNGCSFHGLRSEDPNQHLKEFLKLMDSLDLDGENRERMRLRLFQFSLRDQASNWLEHLPAGSISTWEDLTTRFLAQFFPPGRTAKLRKDILMFQQHHGGSLSKAWTHFKDLLQKPVKAIALPQDVPSTSDHRLIELENQVQRLMEAHLAPTQPTQVNKITTSCEICSGPHDTQYCMKDLERAFVEYGIASILTVAARRDGPKKSTPLLKAITDQYARALPSVRKLNSMLELLGLVPRSYNAKFIGSLRGWMGINVTTRSYEMMNSHYEASIQRKLNPREDANGGVSNFTGRIKGMHVFIGNFTYIVDFMIIEDISSIIDPRLMQVILEKPFIEISNMTHDQQEGIVRFINKNDEVAYKMPHKIEQYNSFSNLEKEHTKSVYLRNEKDKRRGVEYVMSKILRFYKECLELGPEYLTGVKDEGEVT